LDDIFVATDSKEIADVVSSYGGKYIMTSKDHKTGTDRIAWQAQGY
jgi:3-deoxy-manno-octulosonate cytidylyltransferase (CMP-KDO synthetase)